VLPLLLLRMTMQGRCQTAAMMQQQQQMLRGLLGRCWLTQREMQGTWFSLSRNCHC
jgi:hypothetical protein